MFPTSSLIDKDHISSGKNMRLKRIEFLPPEWDYVPISIFETSPSINAESLITS